MPTKRTPRTRFREGQIHPAILAWLRDEPEPQDDESQWEIMECTWFSHDGFFKAWEVCKADILKDWAQEFPGTRPRMWWIVDAPRDIRDGGPYFYRGRMPLLRQRLGGVGSLKSDHLSLVPTHDLGVPYDWIELRDLETWPSLIGKAQPIDPNDPPVFEAQATYLQRHGLLLPGEERRLKPADFAPECVNPE